MATIIDSYSESNLSSFLPILSGGAVGTALGQSFSCSVDGYVLDTCQFYLDRITGKNGGNCYARLYSHIGTYGTSSLPYSLLATSDAKACDIISTSEQLVTFDFTGAAKVSLSSGTKYVIVIYNNTATGINVGRDWTSPSHSGNPCLYNTSPAWVADTEDLIFYINGIILTDIRTVNGLLKASVKTKNGLAIASIKSMDGLE